MERKKFCQISFPVIDSASTAAADERCRRRSQFDNEREIDRLADGEKASKNGRERWKRRELESVN